MKWRQIVQASDGIEGDIGETGGEVKFGSLSRPALKLKMLPQFNKLMFDAQKLPFFWVNQLEYTKSPNSNLTCGF
jgi:hypothetical protein